MATTRDDIQDATGRRTFYSGVGYFRAWGNGAPSDGKPGYAPGCTYQNWNGAAGSVFYVNVGTNTSSNWLNIA